MGCKIQNHQQRAAPVKLYERTFDKEMLSGSEHDSTLDSVIFAGPTGIRFICLLLESDPPVFCYNVGLLHSDMK